MNAFLIYLLKSALFLAGFYTIYFLFLSRDTQYSRNRAFILLSVIFSFLLPVISLNIKENSTVAYIGKKLSEIIVSTESPRLTEAGRIESTADINTLQVKIYLSGVIFFGLKFITDAATLLVLIARKSDRKKRVIRFRRFNTPGFSAFGYIFIKSTLSDRDADEIIKHEQAHLNRFHFFDILLIEITKAIQWFNPFVYLFNKSLRAVHEYQADSDCINSGMGVTGYRNLMMNTLLNTRIFVTSNSFSNPSLIRKRMLMMTKKRSAETSNLKIVLAVPLAIALIILISACEKQLKVKSQVPENVVSNKFQENPVEINTSPLPRTTTQPENTPEQRTMDYPAEENVTNPEPDKAVNFQTTKIAPAEEAPGKVFVVVEEMPGFPGGDKALMDFIYEKIQYPEEAKKNNIQGRVVVRFCINYKGTVDRITVIKGIHPLLDNEAVRVISLLPKWEPGKQAGKPVNVWYSVPINFQLK